MRCRDFYQLSSRSIANAVKNMVAYAGRAHHLILPLRPQTDDDATMQDVLDATDEQFATIDTLVFLAIPLLQVFGSADSSATSIAYASLSALVSFQTFS